MLNRLLCIAISAAIPLVMNSAHAQSTRDMPDDDFRILCSELLMSAADTLGSGQYMDEGAELFPETDNFPKQIAAMEVISKMTPAELRDAASQCSTEKERRGL